jgi:hypothetical protein
MEVDRQGVYKGMSPSRDRFGSGVMWLAELRAIRQWPSNRIYWEILNNEDHNSGVLRMIAAGLRSVHRVRPGVHDREIRPDLDALLSRIQGRPGG